MPEMIEQLWDHIGRWSSFELVSPAYAWLAWSVLALLVVALARYWSAWALSLSVLKHEGGAGLLRYAAWLPRCLRVLGLGFLVLALLRPSTVNISTDSKVQSRDIFLALDVSGSMGIEDLLPNRLEAAKKTLKSFVDRLEGDRVGLVVFAGKAFVQCPLTLDHNVVKYFIDQMQGGTVNVQGTAVGDGLLVALARLQQEPKSGQIVVLATDGISNTGHDPLTAARLALASGVKVYTIGMGRKGGVVVPTPYGYQRMEEPDEKTLTAMAEPTGGRYYRATDNGSLDAICRQISQLERREVKVRSHREVDEHFYPFLWAGAILLLLEALLRLRIRVTA
jgi:Ca-activated chloride channel family protein